MTDPQPPTTPTLDPLWTLQEIARALRIQPNKAYELRAKDQWPNHKVGAKLLFDYSDWLAIKAIYAQTPEPRTDKRTPRTRRTRR